MRADTKLLQRIGQDIKDMEQKEFLEQLENQQCAHLTFAVQECDARMFNRNTAVG